MKSLIFIYRASALAPAMVIEVPFDVPACSSVENEAATSRKD
jgi:hypothetical protein